MMLKTLVMAATSSRMAPHILSADGNFDAVYKGSQLVSKERRLLWHFQYVFKAGKVLSVTVQPKAGRWKKQAYFAKSVYIL